MTLADLIAFDTAHAATVMPYFGQELFTMAEATSGVLTDATYLTAKQNAETAARQNAIDVTLTSNNLDALITPTFDPAWMIDYATGDPAVHGTSSPAAVAGYPHLTVPMGTVGGLPVGMSFIASAWQDAKVLALGYAFEQVK